MSLKSCIIIISSGQGRTSWCGGCRRRHILLFFFNVVGVLSLLQGSSVLGRFLVCVPSNCNVASSGRLDSCWHLSWFLCANVGHWVCCNVESCLVKHADCQSATGTAGLYGNSDATHAEPGYLLAGLGTGKYPLQIDLTYACRTSM